MLIITFGLAGAGKTYVGKLIAQKTNSFFYDGDNDLTDEMKMAINKNEQFSEEIINVFFARLEDKVQSLLKDHKNLLVSQAFFREKNRKHFFQHFPKAIFVLILADKEIRYERLKNRKDMPLTQKYVDEMDTFFEFPTHSIIKIENNNNEEVLKQIQSKIVPLFADIQ